MGIEACCWGVGIVLSFVESACSALCVQSSDKGWRVGCCCLAGGDLRAGLMLTVNEKNVRLRDDGKLSSKSSAAGPQPLPLVPNYSRPGRRKSSGTTSSRDVL